MRRDDGRRAASGSSSIDGAAPSASGPRSRPATPTPRISTGKGTPTRNVARNVAAATIHPPAFFRARRAIEIVAAATMPTTAADSPSNTAATHPMSPWAA